MREVPELSVLALRRTGARAGVSDSAGVAVFVLDAAGHLLVVRSRHRRWWSPPSGYLRRFEPPQTGIARELVEESGLVLDPPPRLVTSVHGPGPRHVTHVFFGRCHDVAPVLRPSAWEVSDARWCAPSELPPLHPSLAEFVDGPDSLVRRVVSPSGDRFALVDDDRDAERAPGRV